MRNVFNFLFSLLVCGVAFTACNEDDLEVSPSVPYSIEFNDSIFHNGDSLYGRVVINQQKMVAGTDIKKIDCRLGNIVIGTTENKMECPFGVRLKDKPAGTHTFSVIIKCEAPDCDETYWRYDYNMIIIKD